MAELSALEQLIEADRQKSAGERFTERMRQVRIAEGRELPEEVAEAEAAGVVVGRLTPPLVEYLASLLEGRDDLEADCIRIAFNIPLPDEQAITAGQEQGGQVHYLTSSLSIRTTRQAVHPYGRRAALRMRRNLVVSRLSVALAA